MNKTQKKPFILIDGSSYLHRAFHALPSLTTSRGEPTGAIYGVINMIRKLLTDYDPEYIAVIFDAKGKNFRHDLYPQYKATRPPMPTELSSQIKPLHEVIKNMGLPLLIIEGVEADDVIGTLAKQAAQEGIPTLISTGDKDIAQIVNKQITLVNTMTNTVLDVEGVENKFGIPPEKIIDYLALIGDTSDNIKGVPMVGPKTAVKWLQSYGSLDNIIAHADEIKGKIGENLRASIPQLDLARSLLTIKDDVKLPYTPKDLKRTAANTEQLVVLFKHLEFNSWLASLLKSEKTTPQEAGSHHKKASNYQTILQMEDFTDLLHTLQHAPSFAFYLETTSLDIIQAEIVGISFANSIGEAAYIPVAHDYEGAPTQLSRDLVLQKLKPLLENSAKIKLGQNLKYDMTVLANYDIELKGVGFDTMLESYVLNSTSNKHDKETLVLKYLGKTITTFEDIAGKGAKQISFNNIYLDKAAPYAAADSDLVLQLHEVLWPQITKVANLEKVFKEIEMPLVTVLSHMERCGVSIDKNLLLKQSKELEKRLAAIEEIAYKKADSVFNLNSPLQLQEVLFTKLKLPVLQKTATGQPSTAEEVLQELSLDYELPKLILEYRSLSKLKSTYTDSLPEQINAKTGRIHTSYNQAVTATGRLSSTNPNLQNIPIRTEEGRKIRQAFIAPAGYKIISADYSQIELRIMAHLSQDPGLIKAFAHNSDIHQATAAEVFGVNFQDVTPNQRRDAKTINFGLIYGMSAFGLAKRLGMEHEIAQKYIELYFTRYPGVKVYMENMRQLAHKLGFVESIMGRRIYTTDINAKNFARRAAAERAAINAPMQGSAADIMKIAMINIDKWIRHSNIDIKMIMQVHDELVFEVAEHHTHKAIAEIKTLMESPVTLNVPIIIHVGIGNNWEEAH